MADHCRDAPAGLIPAGAADRAGEKRPGGPARTRGPPHHGEYSCPTIGSLGHCLHNRPFQCASSIRPAIGAASAPPDRACSITVTTAASVKPANHATNAPEGVRTLPVLPATFRPVTCARCAVPNETASAMPASTAGAARDTRRQYAMASDAGVTSTPSSPSACNGTARVPHAARSLAFAEPVGARRESPSLHLGRQFAGAKSRRIVGHEAVARIRDRRAHGQGDSETADASRRKIALRGADRRGRESHRRRATGRAPAARSAPAASTSSPEARPIRPPVPAHERRSGGATCGPPAPRRRARHRRSAGLFAQATLRPGSGGKQTRDGVAAQHDLVTPVYSFAPGDKSARRPCC